MKKFFVFLVLISLLFNLTNSSFAEYEPYNYRNAWNSWTDYVRDVYLWGFEDARRDISTYISVIFIGNMEKLEDSNNLHEYELLFELLIEHKMIESTTEGLGFKIKINDMNIIREIMTDLYKDPANSFISFNNMFYIAIDKLEGKQIEDKLREHRRSIKDISEILK